MFSSLLTFFSLALFTAFAVAETRPRSVHKSIAKRRIGDLAKLYSTARWSFYDAGLGACGKTNTGSDFIVALNVEQFGSGYPGPHCFEKITMTYNGKTTIATIMDSCPGCPYGGLDLTRGLFTYFASEDIGILYGEWSFVRNSSAASTVSTRVAPNTKASSMTTTKAWVAPTTTVKAWVAATTYSIDAWVTPTVLSTQARVAPSLLSIATTRTSRTKASSTTMKITKARSSTASASASVHTLATSFSSANALSLASSAAVLPTSVSAGSNTTAETVENLQKMNELLTKLGQLIMNAGLADN